MVRAVFKFYHSMDESLIPETPALSRQKIQKLIIPGTPDSSLVIIICLITINLYVLYHINI